jgi:hypothetical protein
MTILRSKSSLSGYVNFGGNNTWRSTTPILSIEPNGGAIPPNRNQTMKWDNKPTRRTLLELVETGQLSWESLAKKCLLYMRESELIEMAYAYEILTDDEEDD